MPSELIWQYSHLGGGMTGNCQLLLHISLFLGLSKLRYNSETIDVAIFAACNPVILNLFTRSCNHHHCLIPEHVHPWGSFAHLSLLNIPKHAGSCSISSTANTGGRGDGPAVSDPRATVTWPCDPGNIPHRQTAEGGREGPTLQD